MGMEIPDGCRIPRWSAGRRAQPEADRQPGDALQETLDQTQKNLALVSRWRKPSLFVSYEKAVAAPDAFLQELSVFLNRPLAVDKSRMVKFMAAGSYKSYDHVVVGNPHLAARFGQPS